MSESLTAINIEQLTHTVNSVVNMKQSQQECLDKYCSIAPHTSVSSLIYSTSQDSIVKDTSFSSVHNKIPVMVTVELPTSLEEVNSTNLLSNITSDIPTTPESSLSVILDGATTQVGLNNNSLPLFSASSFSNQTQPLSVLSSSSVEINDNVYSQPSNITTTNYNITPPQVNSSCNLPQPGLPSLIFSPSDTNNSSRFFMTSPLPIFSVDTPIPSINSYPPRPLSVVSNISGISVFDNLIKNSENVQFLTPLPPLNNNTADKSLAAVTCIKTFQDVNKRTTALPSFYCVECANSHYTPCKHHPCTYNKILDRPVLTRARQTLPSCFKLQPSQIHGHINTEGVYANEFIPKMTQFGPLVGTEANESIQANINIFKQWRIFYKREDELYNDVIDIADENVSNWLMFIKPARYLSEQNIIAIQQTDQIQFIVIKDIEPNTELLFWYCKEYAKLIGFMSKPSRLKYCPYCDQCDLVFPDRASFLQHKKRQHSEQNKRKHRCQYCEKLFSAASKLAAHIMTLHMNIKPYRCDQCGKEFADASNLRIHSIIHTGIKKFCCAVCSKSFRQKAHLESHMLTHTKIKSFSCSHCDRKFARASDLRQHNFSHTKERIFQCSHCSKSFYKLQCYKKHMRIHNNEKNYMCSACQKKFITNYHLVRHLRSCKQLKMSEMLGKLSEGGTSNNHVVHDQTIYIDPLQSHSSTMICSTSTENIENRIINNTANIASIINECEQYNINATYSIGVVENTIPTSCNMTNESLPVRTLNNLSCLLTNTIPTSSSMTNESLPVSTLNSLSCSIGDVENNIPTSCNMTNESLPVSTLNNLSCLMTSTLDCKGDGTTPCNSNNTLPCISHVVSNPLPSSQIFPNLQISDTT